MHYTCVTYSVEKFEFSCLEKLKVLTDELFVFVRDKSTTRAVMEQMKDIIKNVDDGNITNYFFLDFSIAFYCIDY